MNLFAKARQNATPAKVAKKTTKPQAVVDVNYYMALGFNRADAIVMANEFEENMAKWAELKQEEANIKAQSAQIEAEVKRVGRSIFIEKYQATNTRPENFEIVTANSLASAQFITQDNYLKVNDTQAEGLRSVYGDNIVEETIELGFNPDVLALYENEISTAIEKLKIPADAKAKLISSTVVYKIAKGTIDYLATYGKIEEVYNDIQPIVQVKDVKQLN
jgi:hypothetical protein